MAQIDLERHLQGLARPVGSTPLFATQAAWKGEPGTIHANLNAWAPTGRIKDRKTLHILRREVQPARPYFFG